MEIIESMIYGNWIGHFIISSFILTSKGLILLGEEPTENLAWDILKIRLWNVRKN